MSPDQQAIRDLAYRLWEERGRPDGRPEEDWYAAERQLSGQKKAESKAVDEAVKESFPASDAPASGLPDTPPVNADEKWEAAKSAPRSRKRGVKAEPKSDAAAPRSYTGTPERAGKDTRP